MSTVKPPVDEASQLLLEWAQGNVAARDRLLPLVHRELREVAARHLRRERRRCSLQATELVNEAYLRLIRQREPGWRNRTHFFAIAARMMHRILVDRARRQQYRKRGGGAVRVDLESGALLVPLPEPDIVALDEALQRLERRDPRKFAVVELRYFGGLTVEEISQSLGVSPVTVKRDWAFAKAWLLREITGAERTPVHPL